MNRKLMQLRGTTAAIGIAISLAVGVQSAQAAPPSYVLSPIQYLNDPAPGGGTFVNDFEAGGLNNRGDMAFGADASTGGEGVFLSRKGQVMQLGRTGGPAPGGGTFEFGFLGPVAMNDEGDVAFSFLLQPFTAPVGVNAGTYRYSHSTGKINAVLVPFVTPAPDGSTFQGTMFYPSINNRGDIVFPGVTETDDGVHVPGEQYIGLGVGIYRASMGGTITNIASPGDAAPGGGLFDYAVEPWINNGGDVSFIAHIAGEDSVVAGFPPQADFISALGGLYVRNAGTGQIHTIVHPGDPAPRGGIFRQVFHDVMNDRGDIAFVGDLTAAPGANQSIGVFVYSGGVVSAVARPGDPMPGGGALVNASLIGGNVHINNRGDVAFNGVLSIDADGDGTLDTGLFVWSHGTTRLVAHTGTVIPGVGTILQLAATQIIIPPPPIVTPNSGAINNDRGQLLFQATLTDGRGVLLLATPSD